MSKTVDTFTAALLEGGNNDTTYRAYRACVAAGDSLADIDMAVVTASSRDMLGEEERAYMTAAWLEFKRVILSK